MNTSNRLQTLEAEVAQIELAMGELNRKRVQLNREINEYRPAFSKVPPEISTKIFMETFPENSFSSWGKTTPLILGAICHSWREIAWSFPLLWSSVQLEFTVIKPYSPTKNGLFREWLARSSDLPLSIKLRLCEPHKNEMEHEGRLVCEIMDIIARCSERWQHIDFGRFVMFHPGLCFVPTQFPLLVSISMDGDMPDFWHRYGIRDRPIVHWDTPKLQHVHLDSELMEYLSLSLSKITTYSQCGFHPYKFFKVFQEAPYMTRCELTNKMLEWDHDNFDEDLLPDVTALYLKSLTITLDSDSGFNISPEEKILTKLTTPALHELSITSFCSESKFPYSTLESLISRSGCHLMRLSLSYLHSSPNAMAKWLAAMPSLTELILKNVKKISETLKSLRVDQTSKKILLPNLESFSYTQSYYSPNMPCDLDFSLLALMVVSRSDRNTKTPKVAQLKSVYVDIFDEKSIKVDRNVMAKFHKSIAKGMSVRILGVTRPIY